MRGRSLDLEHFEDAILQVLADLELYTYYQLLDVPPDTSGAVAEYSCNLKAHEYRGIQGDPRCSAALFQALDLLIDRLEEARQVLADPQLRAEYDRGLEEGQTRHRRLVEERAARLKRPSRDVRQDVLELLSARLERTIHKEDLHAPEEEVPDVSEGIEPDLLDQQSQALEGELSSYGVTIDVTEEPVAEVKPIEAEYLEKATLHLRREIHKEGATLLHEAAEDEDRSASEDPELVSGLTAQLHAELESMGVPEREEVEAEAALPDAETLARLAWQERRALLELQVDTTVKADPAPGVEREPERFELVIPVEPEEPPPSPEPPPDAKGRSGSR